MTIPELLAESARRRIRLAVQADRLRYEAPAGAMTAEIRAALVEHKPALLEIVWRLEEMRRLATVAPRAVVYAREAAQGGPGLCFSCGDRLEHPLAYGRCAPCDIAADAFYGLKTAAEGVEMIA